MAWKRRSAAAATVSHEAPALPVVLLPMHGECKARSQGLRTRDTHLIEWFARCTSWDMRVVSRPEPWPRVTLARRHPLPSELAAGATFESVEVVRGPGTVLRRDRRRWWVEALRWLPAVPPDRPLVAWNVLAAAHLVERGHRGPLLVDLLDDWTIHPSFEPVHREVEAAYRVVFEHAAAVTANAEGTAALAARHGRSDVQMIPNGVDPERFSSRSRAAGERTVIGYAGTIGVRLDVDLVRAAAAALPNCRFEFAGRVAERHVARQLRRIPNLDLIGNVHYRKYPDLLARWDVAWVPHIVGTRSASGEVGGDPIKINEYRAAGLPTVSTSIAGAGRLSDVVVADGPALIEALESIIASSPDLPRVPRQPGAIPHSHLWRTKAAAIAALLEDAAS